jgi:hypothetical protein
MTMKRSIDSVAGGMTAGSHNKKAHQDDGNEVSMCDGFVRESDCLIVMVGMAGSHCAGSWICI